MGVLTPHDTVNLPDKNSDYIDEYPNDCITFES